MKCCKVCLMDACPACFYQRWYKTNDIIENSKNVITKNVYNYVDCKWPSLVTEPCQDRSCDNFFHHSCQNYYDMETFADKFDQMHDLKKRCKSCVDKMMEAFNNSLKASSNKEVNKSSDNKVYLEAK